MQDNDIYPKPELPPEPDPSPSSEAPKDPVYKDVSPENQAVLKKIEERFQNGEIDAKEYNRLTMAFTPVKFKEEHGNQKPKIFSLSLIIISIIVAIIAIAHIGYFFYFENSFKADNITFLPITFEDPETGETAETFPDESNLPVSTIDEDPVQLPVSGSETGTFHGKKFYITYKYYYDISAQVQSTQNYYGFGFYATLVPRDVCLSWGPLKDASENPHISFRNSEHRSCRVNYDETVDAGSTIFQENSFGINTNIQASNYRPFSNNHLIPSTAEIRDQILRLKKGDKIRIVGYLVNITDWHTSLSSSISRDDPDAHACEVIYVTKLEYL